MGLLPAEIDDGAPVRWSTADDRALEEAIAQARMGLLFVGVKCVFSLMEVKGLDCSGVYNRYITVIPVLFHIIEASELVTCAYRIVLRFTNTSHPSAQSQVYNSPCAIVASFQHRESAARPFAARSVSKWLIEDQMARLEKTWRTLTVGLSLSIRP